MPQHPCWAHNKLPELSSITARRVERVHVATLKHYLSLVQQQANHYSGQAPWVKAIALLLAPAPVMLLQAWTDPEHPG